MCMIYFAPESIEALTAKGQTPYREMLRIFQEMNSPYCPHIVVWGSGSSTYDPDYANEELNTSLLPFDPERELHLRVRLGPIVPSGRMGLVAEWENWQKEFVLRYRVQLGSYLSERPFSSNYPRVGLLWLDPLMESVFNDGHTTTVVDEWLRAAYPGWGLSFQGISILEYPPKISLFAFYLAYYSLYGTSPLNPDYRRWVSEGPTWRPKLRARAKEFERMDMVLSARAIGYWAAELDTWQRDPEGANLLGMIPYVSITSPFVPCAIP